MQVKDGDSSQRMGYEAILILSGNCFTYSSPAHLYANSVTAPNFGIKRSQSNFKCVQRCKEKVIERLSISQNLDDVLNVNGEFKL